MNNLKNENDFISDLVEIFPELSDEILDEDYEGLLTLQIGCLKRFTQKAIDNNELTIVKKCFDFIESNIDIVEKRVENSIVISYLGKLQINKDSKIWKLLSKRLQDIVNTLNEYYNNKSEKENVNKFLRDL